MKGKLLICLLTGFALLPSLALAQICSQGKICCPYKDGSTCTEMSNYTYCTLNGKVVNCDVSGSKKQTGAYCCSCPGNPDQCANAAYYSIYSLDGSLVVDPGGCAGYPDACGSSLKKSKT